MAKRIVVQVSGCDASTSLSLDLTDSQIDTLLMLKELLDEHTGQCKPTMSFHEPIDFTQIDEFETDPYVDCEVANAENIGHDYEEINPKEF